MSCILDGSEKFRRNIHFSHTDTPVMRVSGEIAEVTNQHTCPIPSGVIVRRERIFDGVQGGFEYSSSAQPTGLTKQPRSLRIKGKQWSRHKRFPIAKSSRDRVSSPLELLNRSRDAVDLVGSSSVAGHWILVVLLSVRCLLSRDFRNDDSLALFRGTGLELDLTRALGDRLIA